LWNIILQQGGKTTFPSGTFKAVKQNPEYKRNSTVRYDLHILHLTEPSSSGAAKTIGKSANVASKSGAMKGTFIYGRTAVHGMVQM